MVGDPVLLRNTPRLGVRRDRANLHSSTFMAESGACQRSACRVDTQVFSITFKILWESLGGPAHRSGTGERIRRRKLESPAASRSPGFVVVSSAMGGKQTGCPSGNSRAKRWVSSGLRGWRRGWDSNPRYAFTYSGFRDRHVQPLRHLSGSADFTSAEDQRAGSMALSGAM